MTYVFGGILLFTAGRMALSKGDDDFDPEESRIVKVARKIFPISNKLDGNNFFTRIDGKRVATPLFLVLLVVEGSDVVFAVDSIPAIFGVTTDPFIVFTSNIFAIMGLRSLYFALASLLRDFHYLKYSLIVVLAFVGVKMIIAGFHIEIHALISLGVIVLCLGVGVLASLLRREEEEPEPLTEASAGVAAATAPAIVVDAPKDPEPLAAADPPLEPLPPAIPPKDAIEPSTKGDEDGA
jgi:tellurite resistance protein TerC